MTCQEVQADLSLYLYGELDFAREEAYEAHLSECAFCQLTLGREKTWHAALNAQQMDVPLDVLSRCRQDLRSSFQSRQGSGAFASFFEKLTQFFDIRPTARSFQVAAASLLVMVGFGAARLVDRFQFNFSQSGNAAAISFANSPITRIQNVSPESGNRVRIVVEQVRNGEIYGSPEDERVRELLLAGVRESVDPGIRVDAVEMLSGQGGEDVRDALIRSAENDPNAAVRMKALEGLRQFSNDQGAREALKFVLAHDRDAGVRTEAIDVLVPAGKSLVVTPQLLETLQDVMRDGESDDYVHSRCQQVLQGVRSPADAY